MSLTLRDVMTPSPHTIGERQTLRKAHELMQLHGVRHLPVLEGGKLTGLVSLRDLHLIETLRDVDPAEVEVSEAMSPIPWAVDADTPLVTVAETMAAMKYGSAIATSGGHVVGVFTTVDAMRLLARVLRPARTSAA
jgi:acetoin utilization protein AcuB